MLHGEPKPSRTGRSEHQPVGAAREVALRQSVAEGFVIETEIFHRGAALGDPGGATGFENKDRHAGASFRHPAANRSTAQPIVLELRELFQVLEAVDFASRIPGQFRGELEPKRTSGLRVEMPPDDFAHMRVELRFRLLYFR